jgi:UDP-glucose 4-epimerase
VPSLRRAFVVGGSGFYGSWLVELLEARSIDTLVIDTRPQSEPRTEMILGDVHDIDLPALVDSRKPDVIFQLAGTGLVPTSIQHPLQDLVRNTSTTLTVLEAARHASIPPLVAYVSSAAVYGNGIRFPMNEDHPLRPLSPYGISKLAAEGYVSLYAEMHGVPAFSVRPYSLYGPRQRKLVVYDLLKRMLEGENPLVVAGRPDVTRDFVYVKDAALALIALAQSAPASGEAYNIASGSPLSLQHLVEALKSAAGFATEVQFTAEVRSGDPLRWDGDSSRARALGASFDTPLSEGLSATATWLRAETEGH